MDFDELVKNMMKNLNVSKDCDPKNMDINNEFINNFMKNLNIEDIFKNINSGENVNLNETIEEDELCKECVNENNELEMENVENGDEETYELNTNDNELSPDSESIEIKNEEESGKNNVDFDNFNFLNIDFNKLASETIDFSKMGLENLDFNSLLSMFNLPITGVNNIDINSNEVNEDMFNEEIISEEIVSEDSLEDYLE